MRDNGFGKVIGVEFYEDGETPCNLCDECKYWDRVSCGFRTENFWKGKVPDCMSAAMEEAEYWGDKFDKMDWVNDFKYFTRKR